MPRARRVRRPLPALPPRPTALFLALVLVGAQVLNVALKLTFHRSRPEVAFVHLDTYSFPSGHAMIAIAVLRRIRVPVPVARSDSTASRGDDGGR